MLIFCIDSDKEGQEIFQQAIQLLNPLISCILFENAGKALKAIKSLNERPDFIFLETNLQGMSGEECLLSIKTSSSIKDIPVVMYSTTADQNEIRKYKVLGAAEFIIKSTNSNVLLEKLYSFFRVRFPSGLNSIK
jgi:response regulator RpfG family c-di-GMP phosphodiesterase